MPMIRRGAVFAAFAVLAATSPALAHGKRHHAKATVKLAQADAPEAVSNEQPDTAKPSMTLEEALGVAYETNPELEAAQAGLRASDEDVANKERETALLLSNQRRRRRARLRF